MEMQAGAYRWNQNGWLVRGGEVYDHDGDVHKPALGDILIEDGEIVAVGRGLALPGHCEVHSGNPVKSA